MLVFRGAGWNREDLDSRTKLLECDFFTFCEAFRLFAGSDAELWILQIPDPGDRLAQPIQAQRTW